MFDLTEMENCKIKCVLEPTGLSSPSSRLHFALDPPMDYWLFLAMTHMEAMIVVPDIMSRAFDRYHLGKISPEMIKGIQDMVEQELEMLVQKGMFVGQRPAPRKQEDNATQHGTRWTGEHALHGRGDPEDR